MSNTFLEVPNNNIYFNNVVRVTNKLNIGNGYQLFF